MQQGDVSLLAASQELLFRRRCQSSLLDYAKHMVPGFIVGAHHLLIANALEKIASGEIKRLMVFAPPRHGKSYMVSWLFPAWFFGHNPTRQCMAISYNDDLAQDFGRRVRNTIADEESQRIFSNLRLAKDSKASDRWHTSDGGIYIAAGIHGTLHGRGANLLIIDDPIKSRQEAESKRVRDTLWSVYETDLLSRLMPSGAIVLMHTRWHVDDLAGRILERERDEWHVLKLPAIIGENQKEERALWPEWFPLDQMQERRKKVSPRTWVSLYQQEPIADTGSYFKMQWFKNTWETLPQDLTYYITSDFAVTEHDEGDDVTHDPDYTEFAVWGIDRDKNIYAVDWWYGQTTADVWIDAFLDLVKSYRPARTAHEAGVIRRSVEPFIIRRMRERNLHPLVEWMPPIGDKEARARSFQGLAANGRVRFPKYAPWLAHVMGQLMAFKGSGHDDAVDACALVGHIIDKLDHYEPPRAQPKRNANVDYWRVA